MGWLGDIKWLPRGHIVDKRKSSDWDISFPFPKPIIPWGFWGQSRGCPLLLDLRRGQKTTLVTLLCPWAAWAPREAPSVMSTVQVSAAISPGRRVGLQKEDLQLQFHQPGSRMRCLRQPPFPHLSSSGWTKLVNSQCLWLSSRKESPPPPLSPPPSPTHIH